MGWIANYQTLIVGVIGFAGVIFTLWYNAKLAREHRQEERDHERESLRVSLTEELKINLDSLKHSAAKLREKPTPVAVLVPTDLMDDAYRAFIPKIGLLPRTQVSKVMEAYLSLRTYNAKLFLVGTPVQSNPRHVEVSAEWIDGLAETQENLFGTIEDAIKSLR